MSSILWLLVAALSGNGAAEGIPTKGKWTSLPTKKAVVHRLKLSAGFLGPEDEGWGRVANRVFPDSECVFLPDGAMAYAAPEADTRSGDEVGKWFAKVYQGRKIFARGTAVKEGCKVRVYSRGPELFPESRVKVTACRKRGNFIQVELHVTGRKGFTTKTNASLIWPLLELPIEKLPRGAYALEVIWVEESAGSKAASRHVTAFTVGRGEPD